MTRETKIGLLVGLAFIIVIGILLSDHLTSSTEPASAPLGMVGQKTRDSYTSVGQPNVPVTVETPPPVTPRGPVVTVEEMKTPVVTTEKPVSPVTIVEAKDPLSDLVKQHSSDLAMVGPQNTAEQTNDVPQVGPTPAPGGNTVTPPVPTANSFKEYKAQEGDSLSRIASRLMGANTKANRDAIVAANPSLKDDPNKVIVGKSYMIPTSAALVPPTVAQQTTPTPTPPPAISKVEPKTEPGTYWYTVKENESLWKIAAAQLGTGTAWTTIKDMNKDILKGGDTVHKDMRLRLPTKAKDATASARD